MRLPCCSAHDQIRCCPLPGQKRLRGGASRVEVRTVNDRHLKLSASSASPTRRWSRELRAPGPGRKKVRRGTVQISVRVNRPRQAEDYRLNAVALRSYRDQLRELLGTGLGAGERAVGLSHCWPCPGLSRRSGHPPAILTTTGRRLPTWPPWRLDELEAARPGGPGHGRGPARRWHLRRKRPAGGCQQRPLVVQSCQKRLVERIGALVQDQGVTVEPKDLMRKVAILADRSDMSEEIVRLRPPFAVSRGPPRPGECRAEAQVRGPGDRPRDQHGRVQGRRRRGQPSRG